MNVAKTIIRLGHTTIGASYRKLPLFTMSAVGAGYGNRIKKAAHQTYGAVGAIGDRHGLHTMYKVPQVIGRISKNIERDGKWVSRSRVIAHHMCLEFEKKLIVHAPLSRTHPKRFLHFVIRHYPSYMGGIGVYNLFWRYLEFATPDMSRFARIDLKKLAIERNALAEIYPRCEDEIRKSFKKLARRMGTRPELLSMLSRAEMTKTLAAGKLTVSVQDLQKRQRGYIYLCWNSVEYIDVKAGSVALIRAYVDSLYDTKKSGIVHGTSVMHGKTTGTIIRRIKRSSWPRRPIYITPMTHPSEIPYLKKVKAIVTDEGGGILSHAAIVSRELGIPCVINTKVATKLFQDGDRVEVDATKGIIRKI